MLHGSPIGLCEHIVDFDGKSGIDGLVAGENERKRLDCVFVRGANLGAVSGDYAFDKGSVADQTCIAVLTENDGVAGCACDAAVVGNDKSALFLLIGLRGVSPKISNLSRIRRSARLSFVEKVTLESNAFPPVT